MIKIPASVTKLVFALGRPPSAHQGNSSFMTGHWRPFCRGDSGILQRAALKNLYSSLQWTNVIDILLWTDSILDPGNVRQIKQLLPLGGSQSVSGSSFAKQGILGFPSLAWPCGDRTPAQTCVL